LEWCNNHPTCFATIVDPYWGYWPNAFPVIPDNFLFSTVSGWCLSDILTTSDDKNMITTLCIHKQKNNDNGQQLTYDCCKEDTWMCPTQASLNIICQAHQLGTPSNHLAAIYLKTSTGCHCHIITSQVVTSLCHIVHKVFSILANHQDLHDWS
jgi:hypothetical protein